MITVSRQAGRFISACDYPIGMLPRWLRGPPPPPLNDQQVGVTATHNRAAAFSVLPSEIPVQNGHARATRFASATTCFATAGE